MSASWSACLSCGSFDSASPAYVVIPAVASAALAFGPMPDSWVRSSARRGRCRSRRRHHRRGRRGSLSRCLLGNLHLVVRDDLGAAELLDGRIDERLEGGFGLGGQRARDQEGLLGGDGLFDHPDRCGPVPFIQDEQDALPLLDLLGDLAHELVFDPDVVQAVSHSIQDPAGRAADDRPRGPQDDGSDDDPEPGTTGGTLRAAEIRGLVDLDPEPGPVGDRRIDDLDVRVDRVDLLEPLQQSPRLLAVVHHERGKGLTVLLGHRSGLLSTGTCASLARRAGRRPTMLGRAGPLRNHHRRHRPPFP